jgi:hypothetical protein
MSSLDVAQQVRRNPLPQGPAAQIGSGENGRNGHFVHVALDRTDARCERGQHGVSMKKRKAVRESGVL